MPTPSPAVPVRLALHTPQGAVVLAAFALCACGGSEGPAAAPQVVDSAGVAVVTHPPSLAPTAEWRVDPAAAVSLPGEFHTIVGLVRLANGTLVVGDQGSSEVRYFDDAGAPLAIAGRSGEGPGEYQMIRWLGQWPGDSIAVFDLGSRRVTLLDGRGELLRSFGFSLTETITFASPIGVLTDGTIIATGISETPPGGPATGRQHYPTPVYAFAADGSRPRTTDIGIHSDIWFESFGEEGFSFRTPPFAQGEQAQVGPDRIVHASRETGELRLYRADGTLVRIVRGATGPAVPVTAAVRSAEIERLLDATSDPESRRLYERMDAPDHLPAFTSVHVDRQGYLWIEECRRPGADDDAPALWRVLDPDGLPAGQLHLPARFTPHDIGADYIFGVQRDALDVQTPVIFPLTRVG